MPGIVKVLLLAADHKRGSGSQGLRIDHEIRRAVVAARMGRGPNELRFAAELAIGPYDLVPAVLHHEPAIVHFACHGNSQGVVFDAGGQVPTEALVSLFRAYRGAHTVVLNACETLPVATALSEVVDYAIAMETAVSDRAAIAFSGAFYAALAFGHPVPYAFEMGRVAMQTTAGARPVTPRLCTRQGVDARPVARAAEPETGPGPTDRIEQVDHFDEIEVEGDADLENHASAPAGTDVSQRRGISRSKIGGSLRSVNNAGRNPRS